MLKALAPGALGRRRPRQQSDGEHERGHGISARVFTVTKWCEYLMIITHLFSLLDMNTGEGPDHKGLQPM